MKKRLMALLTALVMLCCAAAALADDEKTEIDSSGTKITYYYNDDGVLTGKFVQYRDGSYEYETYTSSGKVSWKGGYSESLGGYSDYEYKDGTLMNVYFTSGDDMIKLDGGGRLADAYIDGAHYNANTLSWYDDNGKAVDAPDYGWLEEKALKLLKKKKAIQVSNPVWYSNNTACVPGIKLREEYPGLTDKWYNVLPVDVSQNSTQTFDLVASNLYYLGKVTVSVMGDRVIVDYNYLQNQYFQIYPQDECLAWFTGIEQITHEFLENPTSDLKFGVPVSREADLNGQSVALLFICNHVTYRTPLNANGAMPTRYWPNSALLATYFANVKKLLAQCEAEYAEKKAEAGAAGTSTVETVETVVPAAGTGTPDTAAEATDASAAGTGAAGIAGVTPATAGVSTVVIVETVKDSAGND